MLALICSTDISSKQKFLQYDVCISMSKVTTDSNSTQGFVLERKHLILITGPNEKYSPCGDRGKE
jgi:hypothetical protein